MPTPAQLIRSTDVVIKATEAVEALVMKARHGDAAREQAKGHVSNAVMSILELVENPVTEIRSAVEAGQLGSTSPASWSEGLNAYRVRMDAILQLLSATGVFDAAVGDMMPGSMHSQFTVAVGTYVGQEGTEAAWKGIQMGQVAPGKMDVRKGYMLAVAADQLVRFGNASAVISAMVRAGVLSVTDKIFVTALLALTTPVASSGTDLGAVYDDGAVALDALNIDSGAKLHWVASPGVVRKLMTMRDLTGRHAFPGMGMGGGPFIGGNIKPSDHLTTDVLVFDASGFAGDRGTLVVETSRYADIVMDSGPIVDGGPKSVTNMFQTNSVCFRGQRFLGFEALRDHVVASISGVAWGAAESE
jgi:hypothetical protein